MHVYHEITTDSLESVLRNGLKTSTRGEKGDDPAIAAADKFLDEHRPSGLRAKNIARTDVIYAYLATDNFVIDITDGSHVRISDFIRRSDQIILELAVDPKRCYVADLDAFDAVKSALQNKQQADRLEQLAASYWQTLTRLDNHPVSSIKRPELLIPYDLPPNTISIAREA